MDPKLFNFDNQDYHHSSKIDKKNVFGATMINFGIKLNNFGSIWLWNYLFGSKCHIPMFQGRVFFFGCFCHLPLVQLKTELALFPPPHTGLWTIGRWYISDKYGKFKKMPSKSRCLMVKNVHDRQWTVSNIFGPYLRDLLLKIWQIYKKCSNSFNF